MTSYASALAWLYGHAPRGIDLGLTRIERALELRGAPHRAYRVIHVAGTNGKGSTSAMIERGLRAAGLRTGLFTSPHLHRFGERVRIDGVPLSDEAVVRAIEAQRHATDLPELSFFERATLLAFEAFGDAGVEVAVIEVGLGGRLDSTNVVTKDVAVVTHIAMDHEAYLGDTLERVAAEKAGILTSEAPVVTSTRGVTRAVIEARALSMGAPFLALGQDFHIAASATGLDYQGLERRVTGLVPSLAGAHQHENIALALAALELYGRLDPRIGPEALRQGVEDVSWPGRLERVVCDDGTELLFDAAHNPDGCAMLASHLRSLPRKTTALVFGGMRDKALEAMLEALDDAIDSRFYAAPIMARAADPGELAAIRPGRVFDSLDAAYEAACEAAGPEGRVVVAGSIFVLAHVRARALGLESDPPIGL